MGDAHHLGRPRGADGVDLGDVDGDGDLDVTSGWEQAGLVTVSFNPGPQAAREPWLTVNIARGLNGVEDAIFADVDGDGRLDVVSACECRRIVVHFAPAEVDRLDEPAAWRSVTLAASLDRHRWMKSAVADIDQDGRMDIVAGGKAGRPATVAWFQAPADPRDGSAWTYHFIAEAGWTMSLLARDVDGDDDADVVLSDRTYIIYPDGSRNYALRGSRWYENLEGGSEWGHHPIGFGGAEQKFLHVTDLDGDGTEDVLDTVSTSEVNRILFRRGLGDWDTWSVTPVEQPEGVGQIQDVKAEDVDRDGQIDWCAATRTPTGHSRGWCGCSSRARCSTRSGSGARSAVRPASSTTTSCSATSTRTATSTPSPRSRSSSSA